MVKRYDGKTYIIPEKFEREVRADERTKVVDQVIDILNKSALMNAMENIERLKGKK